MTHNFVIYTVLIYSIGFVILGLNIYKYLKTKNPLIGSFIFLWSAMTATLICYIVSSYIFINLNYINLYFAVFIQTASVSLTGIALPYFVYTVFNIKKRIFFKGIIIIGLLLSLSILLPLKDRWLSLINYGVMIFITFSNIYSYIVAFKKILKLDNRNEKKIGLIFMLLFFIFFLILVLTDITQIIDFKSRFAFFPLFYMFIGVSITYLGLTKLDSPKTINDFKTKYNLTKRETEVALLLADGLTYKKIADELSISQGTVSTHVMHIYEKTGTNSKIDLNKEINNFQGK